MAYIGTRPTVGNFVKLDTITTSATTTFNLLNGGVAYFPQSANHCLVSLNGILQAPTDSFTISGSTIIFSSALTTSDVIDFIIVLGDVLNIGTPSDATVTASKIADGVIGLGKLSATGTKDATTFLRGDNTFASAGATAGQVIQVVQTTKTDTFSSSSSTYTDVTGLSASITPSSTSNKILMVSSIPFASDGARTHLKILRGSTTLLVGDSAGSRIQSTFTGYGDNGGGFSTFYGMGMFSYSYLDSPSTTSSTTYKIQGRNGSAGTWYINKSAYDLDTSDNGRSSSTIILMEVKG